MRSQNLLASPVVCVPNADHRVVPSADQLLTRHLQGHHSYSLKILNSDSCQCGRQSDRDVLPLYCELHDSVQIATSRNKFEVVNIFRSIETLYAESLNVLSASMQA